jgi:hypothetical protein
MKVHAGFAIARPHNQAVAFQDCGKRAHAPLPSCDNGNGTAALFVDENDFFISSSSRLWFTRHERQRAKVNLLSRVLRYCLLLA